VTVPLDRQGTGWLDEVPHRPSARIVVTSPDGRTVLDRTVRPGDVLAVPGSQSLRLEGVVYYARLQVVDDWSIPLLYAVMSVALVGLGTATLARQQVVVATVVEGTDGVRLVAKVRLWRNASTSRREIQDALAQALSGSENGSTQ
jgi:hypothetical protein